MPTQPRYVFDLTEPGSAVAAQGFAGPEPEGRWTDGPEAELVLPAPALPGRKPVLLLYVDLRPFLAGAALTEQLARISINGAPAAEWTLSQALFRRRVLAVQQEGLKSADKIVIGLDLPRCAQPVAFGMNVDDRHLALMIRRITIEGAAEMPADTSPFWRYGRAVRGEAAKSFDRLVETGFWSRFANGPNILDIGFSGAANPGLPILETATPIDLADPAQNGVALSAGDDTQDAVFSSHVLQRIGSAGAAIREWFRVTRPGGHIITVVPSGALYERRRRPPSRWNEANLHLYTPATLLAEFESVLPPNAYRVRLLEENDEAYRYADSADTRPVGCYEIVLVIEKIVPPAWQVES